MMNKKAYAVQMSYEISADEKVQAEKALLYFDHASKTLDLANNHLDLIKTPFKENSEMSPDDVMKIRAALRRYRDKSVENFNDFKTICFKCVNIMQAFTSDTQTVKVMKSFVSAIDELEREVNNLVGLFDDLQDKEFAKNIVKSCEDIQKQCEDVEKIIDQRIKTHIKNNILSINWVDNVGKDLQMKIEKKTPLMVDLFNKREEDLNKIIKDRNS